MAVAATSTSLPKEGPFREQSTSSVPKDVPDRRVAGESGSYALALLNWKVKDAERRLLALQASSAILKSKAEKAAEREEFLLGEIAKTNEEMLCK